jgi:hypothetical protein
LAARLRIGCQLSLRLPSEFFAGSDFWRLAKTDFSSGANFAIYAQLIDASVFRQLNDTMHKWPANARNGREQFVS